MRRAKRGLDTGRASATLWLSGASHSGMPSLKLQEQPAIADWMAPLRRSRATLLISNGENLKVAQSQLRPPKITLEVQAQAVSADRQKAHRKVVQMVLAAKFCEKESSERRTNQVETVLGVRGCLKATLPKSAKYFEVLVSAEGFEPSTHALKGHCSTN